MNPEQLNGRRPPVNNSSHTDFFADDDRGFVSHRDSLVGLLSSIVASQNSQDPRFRELVVVKVTLRADALAKSHRPQARLFRETWTPHVGTERLGELLFATTPASLNLVIGAISAAEDEVPWTEDSTGARVRKASISRCEASAIESISVWGESNKQSFSASEAAHWLSASGSGGRYFVDLFSIPRATAPDATVASVDASYAALIGDLSDLGVVARAIRGKVAPMIELGVLPEGDPSLLQSLPAIRADDAPAELEGDVVGDLPAAPELVFSPVRHQSVLAGLVRNPLVRAVRLPPRVEPQSDAVVDEPDMREVDIFVPTFGSRLPVVGVIDGGIAGPIANWVVERWGQLVDGDRNIPHASFIAGLLVAAGELNEYLAYQTLGCTLVDIDVLPRDPDRSGAIFESYYPYGVVEFMDEIESAVEHFRTTRSVRVFTFSINAVRSPDARAYGYMAERLDAIAARLDVIFAISAGNLEAVDMRPEWSPVVATALADLARDSVGFATEPSESLYNASVSALNPPGLERQVPMALARYSRRGPGLRGAVKPDFGHVGGSGTPSSGPAGHGLFSVNELGLPVSGSGTSYAAPIVARRIADLDASIEALQGGTSRETLIALMVHHATTPIHLTPPSLRGISRDIVGFGVPAPVQQMLQTDDSSITIVIQSVLKQTEQHSLVFNWPPSLVQSGNCRGQAKLTLVARPVLDYRHGDERIRVNVDASLMQLQADGGYKGQLKSVFASPRSFGEPRREQDLLKEASKWQVIKSSQVVMPRGRGTSSQWKLVIEYLTRANEALPAAGVEFAAILTIGDDRGVAPVFQEMRAELDVRQIRTSDIRTRVQQQTQV